MLKRLLPFVLILLMAGSSGIFLCCQRDGEVAAYQSQAIKVVPEDAVWIIESGSLPDLIKALVQSKPLFPSLQQIGSIKPHLQAVRKIDSLITRNPRFRELYGNSPSVISLHQTGKNQFQFLLVLEDPGASGLSEARNLFSALSGNPGQWSQRTYNGQQINRITFGADALLPGVSMAGNKKYLVISPSPILLENAVRQMSLENGLYNSPAFSKLSHTAGKSALANVYINLKSLPTWLSGWMNPQLRRKLEMFSRYGDWASLDLTIRDDAVWLNGFALEGDTLNSYLNLFRSQVPQKLEAEKYLPSTTAAYFSLGVEKPAAYLRDLSDFLGGGESGRKRQRTIDKAVAITKEDVVRVWADLGFRELTIGYLCGVAYETVTPIALVEVKNRNQASDKLVGIANLSQKKVLRVDDQHDFELYPMPYEGLPEILGGSFFSAVSGKYFTLVGNVLVLADEMQILEEILHKYSLNKTLANDAVYQSLAGLVSTRSNVTFFAIPYKARPLLKEILNPKAAAAIFADDRFLLNTGAVGLQFNSTNGMSLHNLFASFAPIDYSRPQTVWESRLDARAATRPVIVTNHVTKDHEIILQDETANLYLINSSGRILWKKNIGERINSEIFQVDVLKNGRLQYLFSTRNAIHLIDRNGAYLPKYPVKMKLPATNGMALIDFDHNRDYRILIACTDNRIYGFDKNGSLLKGWNFGPASGPITQPVQYFKIQNKDYLLFADPVKVYATDRKGTLKVKPDKDFAVSSNNRIVYQPAASGKGPGFLLTDVDAAVHSISLDGKVESKKFGDFSPDHYFDMQDVNKDGLNEYVFIDRGKIEIFSQSGEKLVSRKLAGGVASLPDLYLFNGFPCYAPTLVTIGSLDKAAAFRNILVGGDDNYLYNYAIK